MIYLIALNINWTAIGAIGAVIAAIVAIFYTLFTYQLLKESKYAVETNNKLVEFQIYSKLSDQLSSEKAAVILDIIEKNWFYIEEITDRTNVVHENPKKDKLLGKDIRRYILGPIEDLSKFKDDGLLSMESIDTGFGNIILMLGNNEAVVDYIKYLRKKIYFADNIHCGFESLYEEEIDCCQGQERDKYTNHFKGNQ
jgi:hypothetical protein